jgi:hypothetical protein
MRVVMLFITLVCCASQRAGFVEDLGEAYDLLYEKVGGSLAKWVLTFMC